MNVVQIEIFIFLVVFIILSVVTFFVLKKKNNNQNDKKPNAPTIKKPPQVEVSGLCVGGIKLFIGSLKSALILIPAFILFSFVFAIVFILTNFAFCSLLKIGLTCA